MVNNGQYTITMHPPQNTKQLWGARCEELKLNASGKTEGEAFYNLIENIPVYFEIKNEAQRHHLLTKNTSHNYAEKSFQIPAFV